MSSTYSLLCLNHDPALVLANQSTLEEISALRDRSNHEFFDYHENCDVVAGRFSYPLVEVGCFGDQFPGPTGCRSLHSGLKWIDSDVLRLVWATSGFPDAADGVLRPFVTRCWPVERIRKLRVELGIE